jgi:hypothetical protein
MQLLSSINDQLAAPHRHRGFLGDRRFLPAQGALLVNRRKARELATRLFQHMATT